jgi:hypothetical protein
MVTRTLVARGTPALSRAFANGLRSLVMNGARWTGALTGMLWWVIGCLLV